MYPCINCHLSKKKKKKKNEKVWLILPQIKFYSLCTAQKIKFSFMDYFSKFLLQFQAMAHIYTTSSWFSNILNSNFTLEKLIPVLNNGTDFVLMTLFHLWEKFTCCVGHSFIKETLFKSTIGWLSSDSFKKHHFWLKINVYL